MNIGSERALELVDEEVMLLEMAAQFCTEQMPLTALRPYLELPSPFPEEWWRQVVELGWTGLPIDEVYGGSGMGFGALVPIAEALGRVLSGLPFGSTMLSAALLTQAPRAYQSAVLPRIVAGDRFSIVGLQTHQTDPDKIVLANGRLQGRARFVDNANVAEGFLVVAATAEGPCVVFLERSHVADDAIKMHALVDLTKRSGAVQFDHFEVSPDNIWCDEKVTQALREVALLGSLLTAAESVGAAITGLQSVVEYLKTRKQFGRFIGSYQGLKHPTVDLLCEIESARSLLYHGASQFRALPLHTSGEIAARMAKLAASEVLLQMGDRAVQFHGGFGFTWDCDAGLILRRAQWAYAQFGTPSAHRSELAGLMLDKDR
jgi:alkylation response protein AidB-like acyl-CoA dehydrogenase